MANRQKHARIESMEQMLLMSASSVDVSALGDEATTADLAELTLDREDAPNFLDGTFDQQTPEPSTSLSRLTDMFFSSKQQRRSPSLDHTDVVSRDVQEFETRQLLSATVAAEQSSVVAAVDGGTDDHPDQVDQLTSVIEFNTETSQWVLQGSLETEQDIDVFAIRIDQPTTMFLRSTSPHVRMEFIGTQPNESGPLLEFSEGTYHLQVRQSGLLKSDPYTIELALDPSSPRRPLEPFAPDAPDDYPDMIDPDSTPVPYNADELLWRFEGVIASHEDVDVFAITVEETVEVSFRHAGANTGIAASFVGRQPGVNGPLRVLTPGTWYVQTEASRYSNGSTYNIELGQYRLSSPQPPSDDHPNVITPEIAPAPYDSVDRKWTFSGTLSDLQDVDVFAIVVDETVEASLDGVLQGDTPFAFAEFVGAQPATSGPLSVLTPGTWYVQVRPYESAEGGDYRLNLNIDGSLPPTASPTPAPEGPTDVFPIEVPGPIFDDEITFPQVISFEEGDGSQTVYGQINGTGPQRYQFEVIERSRVSLNTDFPGNVRLLNAIGEDVTDFVDNQDFTELPRGFYQLLLANVDVVKEFQLTVSLESIFVDAVPISAVPEHSLNAKPEFQWDAQAEGGEYEMFIGYRGQAEAVYRTSGITGTTFEMPESLAAGPYVAWVRWHGDGEMSRWGIGHDFVVAQKPATAIQEQVVTWAAIAGADRYEIQVAEIASDGSYIRQNVIRTDDLTNNQFAIPEDLQDQRLAVWVRAIQETDTGLDQTAWSKVVTTHEVEYPEPIDFSVSKGVNTLNVTLPNTTTPPAGSDSPSFEVFVEIVGQPEKTFRTKMTLEGQFVGDPPSTEITLPDEFASPFHVLNVWVREVGSGLSQSRWGEAQPVGASYLPPVTVPRIPGPIFTLPAP